jgi:hypothetical protein
MTTWIRRHIDSRKFHVGAVLAFLLLNAIGYAFFGGRDFVLDWGGGFAAVIATFFLVFKSQGYWAWMVVNASLWCYLFFDMDLPLLGWLQVSFLVFCTYGFVQWALVNRIGFKLSARPDQVGAVLAVGFFAVAAWVYWPRDGMTTWWALEAGSVFFAVGAVVLDAFKYRVNWVSWTLSNLIGWPLYYHNALWGVFFTTFIYQAINVYGWIVWTNDERQPIVEEMEQRGAPDGAQGVVLS